MLSEAVVYKRRKPKWDWARFLTSEEKLVLQRASKAKSAWQRLNKERAGITNRAIHRAKYAALSQKPTPD